MSKTSHTAKQLSAVYAKRLSILKEIDGWFIMFGTLLGYARGGALIDGDDDVDFAVPQEHFDHVLAAARRQVSEACILTVGRSLINLQSASGHCDFYFFSHEGGDAPLVFPCHWQWPHGSERGRDLHVPAAMVHPIDTARAIKPAVRVRARGYVHAIVPRAHVPARPEALAEYLYGSGWGTPLAKGVQYVCYVHENRPRIAHPASYWDLYYVDRFHDKKEPHSEPSSFAHVVADRVWDYYAELGVEDTTHFQHPIRVIDVGCGDGRDLAAFLGKRWRRDCVGVDASQVARDLVRERFPSVDTHASLRDVPAREGGGLTVVYMRFFTHTLTTRERDELLAQAKRLIEGDCQAPGILAIESRRAQAPASDADADAVVAGVQGVPVLEGDRAGMHEYERGHFRRFETRGDLCRAVERAGFAVSSSCEGRGYSVNPATGEDPSLVRVIACL